MIQFPCKKCGRFNFKIVNVDTCPHCGTCQTSIWARIWPGLMGVALLAVIGAWVYFR